MMVRYSSRLVLTLLLWSNIGHAGPAFFTYQGQIVKPNGAPLEASNVQFTIDVLSHGAERCLLYQERHTVNMTNSNGIFAIEVGSGARSGTDYEDTNTLANALSNSTGLVTPTTCASVGTYNPSATHGRKLRVTFNDGSGSVTLSQLHNIVSVPYATNASTIDGLTVGDLLTINTSGTYVLTQANLENLFDTPNHNELLALIAGTSTNYLQATPSADFDMNSNKIVNVDTPTAGTDAANKNYVDANLGGMTLDTADIQALTVGNAGEVLTWNGTQWVSQTVSTMDATKLPLAGGTMSGTLDMNNNDIIDVNNINASSTAAGVLTALDATFSNDLTVGNHITASGDIHSNGSIHADGSLSANGDITSSGEIKAHSADFLTTLNVGTNLTVTNNVSITGGIGVGTGINSGGTISLTNGSEINFRDADDSNFVGFAAPAIVGADLIWTLPAADGTVGQVLQTDGSGMLNWVSLPSSGEVNTASNVGAGGVAVYKQKTGLDFEFKSINAGSAKVTITNDGPNNEVDINVDESQFALGNIPNTPAGNIAATNAQAAINELDTEKVASTRTVGTAADSGLTGGGDLSANRSLSLDIPGTTDLGAAADNADSLLIYDASGSAIREVTRAQFNLSETEVDAFVSDNGYALDADKVERSGDTMTGALNIDNEQELRLSENDGNGAEYVGLKAPAAVGTSVVWTLPAADGTVGQVLQTDGAGNLSFIAIPSAPVSTVFGRSGVVVAAASDYDANQVDNTPAGAIAATNVQAAINELDTEKVGATRTISTAADSGLTGGGDLSANRSLSLDIPGTTNLGAAADDADSILVYDASGSVIREVTRAQFNLSEAEVDAFVADNGYAADADKVDRAGDTMTGDLALNASIEMQFNDADNSNYVGFVAPAIVGTNVIWTLPAVDGTTGQVLETNGSGVLQWKTLSAVGETNTGSNVGSAGVGVFDGKVGVDLQFKNVAAGSAKVTITDDSGNNEIDINVDETQFALGSIPNTPAGNIAATNAQAAINELDTDKVATTRTISTAADSGLAGGGDLSANRSLSLDIPGTTNLGAAADDADSILVYDVSGSALREVTRAQFNLSEAEVDAMVADNGYAADADKVDIAGDTMTGDLTMAAAQEIRFNDADNSNYIGFVAPATVGTNLIWELPAADGTAGQVLQTDGAGALTWVSQASGADNLGNHTATTDLGMANNSIINLEGGSAGTPGLSFNSDANTGLFSGAADTLSLSTAGNEALTIDASGRVGVGTTSPAVQIEIQNSSNGPPMSSGTTQTNASMRIGNDINNNVMDLGINGSNGAWIQASHRGNLGTYFPILLNPNGGRVGIGLSSPPNTFEVSGPLTSIGGQFNIGVMDSAAMAQDVGGGIVFKGAHSGPGSWAEFAGIRGGKENGTSNNADGYLSLHTRIDANSNPTEQMRITSIGNIGIGTTNPSQKLDVEGTILSGPKGTSAGDGGSIVFEELAASAGSEHVGFRAPDDVTASVIWQLPAADGTNGQVLETNGAGVLQWRSLSAVGETNTGSNVGVGGVAVFKQKTGVNLEFRSVNAGSSKVTITSDAGNNEIDINVDEAQFALGTIPNTPAGNIAATNAQAAINELDTEKVATTRTIATAADSGLTGGGDLSANRSFSIDIPGTTDLGAAADNADTILVYDASGTALREVTRAQFNLSETEVDAMVANNGYASSASKVSITGDTMTGGLVMGATGVAAGDGGTISFKELVASAGDDHVGFRAPDDVTTSVIWQLPAADGTSGQVLQTNGSGVLSWANSSGSDNLGNHTATTDLAMVNNSILGLEGGSAAAPGLSFNSDSNTGLFSAGADTLSLSTAGNEALTINAAGYVGIGTTIPTARLTLRSDTAAWTVAELLNLHNNSSPDGNGSGIVFSGENNVTMSRMSTLWDSSNNMNANTYFEVRQGGALVRVMKLSTNVQIGLESGFATYDHKVNIYTDSTTGDSVSSALLLSHSDSDSGGSNGIGNQITFEAETSTDNTYANTARIISVLDDAANNSKDGSLRFHTLGPNVTAGSNTPTEKVRIDSSGNVGIGTTSPMAKLSVDLPTRNVGGTLLSFNSDLIQVNDENWADTRPSEIITKDSTLGFSIGARNGPILLSSGDNGNNQTQERMRITTAGNVGIGTAAPTSALDVNGAIRSSSGSTNGFYIGTANTLSQSGSNLRINNTSGARNVEIYAGNGQSTPSIYIQTSDGNVGIGTTNPGYKLDVSGDLRITGTPYRTGGDIAWQVPSDARLKDVTGPYEHGLEALTTLDMIRFRYKENNPVGADISKEYIGVLAQNVQKVIPEAVNEDKEGFLSLNTTPIFWSMINAIKELYNRILGIESHQATQDRQIASKADKTEIEALKAKNQKLEQENAIKAKELEAIKQDNAEMKARLDKIEKMLNSK